MNSINRNLHAFVLILGITVLTSCSGPKDKPGRPAAAPPARPAPTSQPPVSTPITATLAAPGPPGFEFPGTIDPAGKYMFYLHGKIIEDQGLPAVNPDFGEYFYIEILETLQGHGFVVISEQRPKDCDGARYAGEVVSQVKELLGAGVPPESITVVGASKGAAIAALVSNLVGNPEVNYVLLGSCFPPMVAEWQQQGGTLSGNVLAIYDSSDKMAGSCQELFDLSKGEELAQHEELVLQVGSGHGILYQPLPEWVLPTVDWAKQDW